MQRIPRVLQNGVFSPDICTFDEIFLRRHSSHIPETEMKKSQTKQIKENDNESHSDHLRRRTRLLGGDRELPRHVHRLVANKGHGNGDARETTGVFFISTGGEWSVRRTALNNHRIFTGFFSTWLFPQMNEIFLERHSSHIPETEMKKSQTKPIKENHNESHSNHLRRQTRLLRGDRELPRHMHRRVTEKGHGNGDARDTPGVFFYCSPGQENVITDHIERSYTHGTFGSCHFRA